MFGLDLLQLKKVLERHKWNPSLGHEEIDRARRREILLLRVVAGSLLAFLALLVLAGIRSL